MNPAFEKFADYHDDAAVMCGNTRDGLAEAAIAAAISIIDQHIPSLTDEDEQTMLAMPAPHFLDSDVANFAIRTCACGKKIGGFYEYVDHLKEVLRGP